MENATASQPHVVIVGAGFGGLEAAKSLTVIAPDGTPRMFAADQDSSGTRLCFESPDTTLPPGARSTGAYSGAL